MAALSIRGVPSSGLTAVGGILERDVAGTNLLGHTIKEHTGAEQVFGRNLRHEEDVACVDGVAASLDELYDVESVLCLDDWRHFAWLEGESGRLKVAHHVAARKEAEFAAFLGGTRVLRVESGEHGEFLTLDDSLAQLGELGAYAVALGLGNLRLDDNLGELVAFGDSRQAVGGESVEEFGHLAGCDGDIFGELVFDAAGEEVATYHALVLFLKLVV